MFRYEAEDFVSSGRLSYGSETILLTLKPLKNKQTRFNINPGIPPTKCVAMPEKSTDTGTRKAELKIAARNLSSGTHSPPRRFSHFLTMRSERRPVNIPPTGAVLRSVSIYESEGSMNGSLLMFPRPDGRKQAPIKASFVIPYLWP